jgi:ankyrin repeat protein
MMHSLCERVDVAAIEHWLSQFPNDLHKENDLGETPFYTSCAYGNLSCANYLFERGSNLHVLNLYGETALHKASENGHLDTVDFLLFHGANVNSICHYFETPIMRAVRQRHEDVALFLLAKGADSSRCDAGGCTPLMHALLHGMHSFAHTLIDQGASIRGSRTSSPLTIAIDLNSPLIVYKLLSRGALKDKEMCTLALVKLLAWTHHTNLLLHMIHLGVLINRRPRNENPPLLVACSTYFGKHMSHVALEYTEILLRHGAYPNIRGSNNDTALLCATRVRNIEMVELLLRYKANPNLRNNHRATPLTEACILNDIHMVKLLLPYSNLSLLVNTDHSTYLMYAAHSGNIEIATLFLHFRRYSVRAINKMNMSASSIAQYLKHTTMVNFLEQVDIAQHTTTVDSIADIRIEPDLWKRMLPSAGKHALDIALQAYRVDSLACYYALFLNEGHLLRKYKQGEPVYFSAAGIRCLTRAMGNRPIRWRIVSYLVFPTKSRLMLRLCKGREGW